MSKLSALEVPASTNGASVATVSPWALPTGASRSTVPRAGTLTAAASMSSGDLYLTAIALLAGDVVSSVTYVAGAAASSPTNQWFSLWDADRNQLGLTADDGATAWAAGPKTLALTAPYEVTESGLYYLGIVVVATTVPTLVRAQTNTAASGIVPILVGVSSTGRTNPASAPATAAAITPGVSIPYAYVA